MPSLALFLHFTEKAYGAVLMALMVYDSKATTMKRVAIALPVGALATMIGPHGVALVGYSGDVVAQAWGGDHLVGFCMQCDSGQCERTVKGHTPGALPCFRAHLRAIDLAGADRV